MDSCSIKHCMMAGGIIGKLTPSFRSQIGHDGDQICNIHHFAPLTPPSWRGVQMMEMPYLRTMLSGLDPHSVSYFSVVVEN